MENLIANVFCHTGVYNRPRINLRGPGKTERDRVLRDVVKIKPVGKRPTGHTVLGGMSGRSKLSKTDYGEVAIQNLKTGRRGGIMA